MLSWTRLHGLLLCWRWNMANGFGRSKGLPHARNVHLCQASRFWGGGSSSDDEEDEVAATSSEEDSDSDSSSSSSDDDRKGASK